MRSLARFAACALTVCVGVYASADDTPSSLLRESLSLARQRTDGGDVRTTAALRLGATLRLAGLPDDANAALEECATLVAKNGDPDGRDETKVELAREFFLLGNTDRAYALAAELRQREYDLLAYFMFAREAGERRDAPAAERAIRMALEIAQRPGRKIDPRMGSSLLCAIGRAANAVGHPALARKCEDLIPEPVWKAALTADRAESSARAGDGEQALRTAAQAADPHMAILALARVAGVFGREPRLASQADECIFGPRPESVLHAAKGLKDAEKRDFALRIAVGRIGASGNVAAARRLAREITSPAARLLAIAPLVEASIAAELPTMLAACSAEDRPALAEVLVVACGRSGLAPQALSASEHVPQGWSRIRALCDAAKFLPADAARPLLTAAIDQLSHLSDRGLRCVARSQIALTAQRAGDYATAAEQSDSACGEASEIESVDDLRAVLPQTMEAALDCRRSHTAAQAVLTALRRTSDPALRDVLLPLLVDAGHADAALREVAAAPPENDYAKRFFAYRLARNGRVAEAVRFARTLTDRSRAEVLCDIARALLPDATPTSKSPRRVALSLHGGWFYWPHRLERAGIAWDVMPFLTPYEEGAAGLAARYSMLGYPGAGDHLIPCSPIGVEHVRRYLREGGGLFGICAGQLFATGHPNGHRFVAGDFYYLRGSGPHQVRMTGRHPAAPALPSTIIINRQNGDFMIPRPGCDVLGWYDDQHLCAAVMASHYGLGRVVVSSPHPEGDNSYSPTDRLCIEITRWILDCGW